MVYVVAYDVEDDAVRGRVAGIVEQFGRRVQKSVFECSLTPEMIEELTARLARVLIPPGVGSVRLYRVCAACWGSTLAIGTIEPDERQDAVIVV